ncbi:MAG TPA: flavodoxin-dependent (E)-4-hydroxy-3-methylbut-2-enyl-diphosphate synthase, partial [Puia sp.]
RVSLTEDPEFEIPVCKDLVKRYEGRGGEGRESQPAQAPAIDSVPYSPFEYKRRAAREVINIGDHHVPVVVADFMSAARISREDLKAVGYNYHAATDKWNIGDTAADYLYTGWKVLDFDLPGTLRVICDHAAWLGTDRKQYFPLYQGKEFLKASERSPLLNFIAVDAAGDLTGVLDGIRQDGTVVICCWSSSPLPMMSVRRLFMELMNRNINCPVILAVESEDNTVDEQLIHFSTEAGALLLDGMGDGVWLMNESKDSHRMINNVSFSILQATRTRISKTEYISCPSCGRTLFDLQETTARIRSVTHHLKGVKIAIMGCIVNGPGEMADADFGYVGSGPGKITLYRGKEVVKRGVDSSTAVQELINLLKESSVWVEPAPMVSEGRGIS